MGERKVLNKYIPPDFDPSKMPRGKRMEQGRMEMRMMLPMSIQCEKCGNFMYRGSKFNSKKEDVIGESYMGIKIFRFIMKCTQCNGFFSIKTDPKNADYCVEYGVTRNYEPWREQRAEIADEKVQREEEGSSDAMRSLEQRTEDSRRQLEMLDDLEELRAMKAAHGLQEGMTAEQILALSDQAALEAAQAEAQAEEEESEFARAAFAAARRQVRPHGTSLAALAPALVSSTSSSAQPAGGSSAAAQPQHNGGMPAPSVSAGAKRARTDESASLPSSAVPHHGGMPAFPFAKRQAVVTQSQTMALPIAVKPKVSASSSGPPSSTLTVVQPQAGVQAQQQQAQPPLALVQRTPAGLQGGLVDYGSSSSDSEG